jgi:hypothetical protein
MSGLKQLPVISYYLQVVQPVVGSVVDVVYV